MGGGRSGAPKGRSLSEARESIPTLHARRRVELGGLVRKRCQIAQWAIPGTIANLCLEISPPFSSVRQLPQAFIRHRSTVTAKCLSGGQAGSKANCRRTQTESAPSGRSPAARAHVRPCISDHRFLLRGCFCRPLCYGRVLTLSAVGEIRGHLLGDLAGGSPLRAALQRDDEADTTHRRRIVAQCGVEDASLAVGEQPSASARRGPYPGWRIAQRVASTSIFSPGPRTSE